MPKIDSLDGGICNARNPQLIFDNQLQEARNYEYIDGYPSIRKTIKQSDIQEGLNLTGLTPAKEVTYWMPSHMPKDSYGDIVYLVYTIENELYIMYQASATLWDKEQVIIDNINYTNVTANDMVFIISPDRVLIADNTNKIHYFTYSKYGVLQYGISEYPSPYSKPITERADSWDDLIKDFEEEVDAQNLGDMGLYQDLYCYADEFGNLSNPSPKSDICEMQFFKISIDADDKGVTKRWLDKRKITNIEVYPDLDDETLLRIKEFYYYRRYIKYSEEGAGQPFYLYKIVDIQTPTGKNEFLDTVTLSSGEAPSYGNIAPVAKDGVSTSQQTFLAGCKIRTEFLWDFKWHVRYSLENTSNKTFTDRAFIIRVYENDIVDIENNDHHPFAVSDFIDTEDATKNSQHLRWFDLQRRTPLETILLEADIGSGYLEVMVKIPQMSPGVHNIYLTFTPEADSGFDGVPDDYNDFIHGKWFQSGSDNWGEQPIVKPENVRNSDMLVCAPMEIKEEDTDTSDVINKVNTELNGELQNANWGIDTIAFINKISQYPIGDKKIILSSSLYSGVKFYGEDSDEEEVPIKPDSKTPEIARGFFRFNITNLVTWSTTNLDPLVNPTGTGDLNYHYNVICGNYGKSSAGNLKGWFLGIRYDELKPKIKFLLVMGNEEDVKTPIEVELSGWFDIAVNTNYKLLYYISIDFGNNKVSFHAYSHGTFEVNKEDLDITADHYDTSQEKIQHVVLGNNFDDYHYGGCVWETIDEIPYQLSVNRYYNSVPYSQYSEFVFEGSKYVNSIAVMKNIMNFLPEYEDEDSIIGYNWSIYNNHIVVKKAEQNSFEEKNTIMWTDANGFSFNESQYKKQPEAHGKLIVLPYFDKADYGLSILELTKHKLYRLLLIGDPSTWSVSTQNFIEEFSDDGLESLRSVGKLQDSIFWHSKGKFMMWNSSLLVPRDISSEYFQTTNGKIAERRRLIVPETQNFIGIPCPINSQYWFHNPDSGITYIYHKINDVWTDFYGLDISKASVLLDGTLLLLDSQNIVSEYPSNSNTSSTTSLVSKQYGIDNNKVRRFRIDFDGSMDELIVSSKNRNADLSSNFTTINRMITYGLPLSFWGEWVEFAISGVDKLKSLQYNLRRR